MTRIGQSACRDRGAPAENGRIASRQERSKWSHVQVYCFRFSIRSHPYTWLCSNLQSLWKTQKEKKKKKRNIFMRDSYAPVPEIVCTKKKKNIKDLGITFPPSAVCSRNPSFARSNLPIIELISQSWYTKADLRLTSQVELHCSLHNPPV